MHPVQIQQTDSGEHTADINNGTESRDVVLGEGAIRGCRWTGDDLDDRSSAVERGSIIRWRLMIMPGDEPGIVIYSAVAAHAGSGSSAQRQRSWGEQAAVMGRASSGQGARRQRSGGAPAAVAKEASIGQNRRRSRARRTERVISRSASRQGINRSSDKY